MFANQTVNQIFKFDSSKARITSHSTSWPGAHEQDNALQSLTWRKFLDIPSSRIASQSILVQPAPTNTLTIPFPPHPSPPRRLPSLLTLLPPHLLRFKINPIPPLHPHSLNILYIFLNPRMYLFQRSYPSRILKLPLLEA